MQKGMAGAFRGHVDPFVGNVAARNQEFANRAVLLFLGAKIDVGEDALAILKQVQIVGTLQAIGDRAENA